MFLNCGGLGSILNLSEFYNLIILHENGNCLPFSCLVYFHKIWICHTDKFVYIFTHHLLSSSIYHSPCFSHALLAWKSMGYHTHVPHTCKYERMWQQFEKYVRVMLMCVVSVTSKCFEVWVPRGQETAEGILLSFYNVAGNLVEVVELI